MIHVGDCVEVMAGLEPGSVDAVVCDPPYHLTFMGRDWDHAPSPVESQAQHGRWAREALRVLKPGGHLLAFGGTRTYHRLACALEDAGFEIRDCLCWLYGSGFPKSLDVSKAIDKAAGAEREETGRVLSVTGNRENGSNSMVPSGLGAVGVGPQEHRETIPATEDAKRWEGWGTALKPAFEPIVLARKPLSGTVAGNVLEHGTGALNIDGCRIEGAPRTTHADGDHRQRLTSKGVSGGAWGNPEADLGPNDRLYEAREGRWPANVILDEQAAEQLDAQTGELHSQDPATRNSRSPRSGVIGFADGGLNYSDSGGASRFFYVAKASRAERNAGLEGFEERKSADDGYGSIQTPKLDRSTPRENWTPHRTANHHPTVKPVALMRWLVRLVTPPSGLVLDPFAGSGTTGVAAALEGFRFVGIERDEEYAALATARLKWWEEHGEDALRIVRERERSEQEREAVAATGQLGLLDL